MRFEPHFKFPRNPLVKVRFQARADRRPKAGGQPLLAELKPYIYAGRCLYMRVYGCIMRVGAYMGLTGIFGQLENFRS